MNTDEGENIILYMHTTYWPDILTY